MNKKIESSSEVGINDIIVDKNTGIFYKGEFYNGGNITVKEMQKNDLYYNRIILRGNWKNEFNFWFIDPDDYPEYYI